MEVSSQPHAPAALTPGKEPLVGYEAGCGPELIWTWWWRETFPIPARTQIPDHPAHSSVLYH